MFFLPLASTRGLSDFQIDYIHQHIGPKLKVKMGLVAKLVVLVTLAITVSLWVRSYNPELLSERVTNFTGFGVLIVTLLQVVVGFFLMLSAMVSAGANLVVGGLTGVAKAISETEQESQKAREFADLMDAKRMKLDRNSFVGYSKTLVDRMKASLRWIATFAFIGGLVATGYTLAPLVVLLVHGMLLAYMIKSKSSIVKRVKTLDVGRVDYLEGLLRAEEAEDAQKQTLVIEAE